MGAIIGVHASDIGKLQFQRNLVDEDPATIEYKAEWAMLSIDPVNRGF
jgi:hypothetical protein